jgi:hypothetical protein
VMTRCGLRRPGASRDCPWPPAQAQTRSGGLRPRTSTRRGCGFEPCARRAGPAFGAATSRWGVRSGHGHGLGGPRSQAAYRPQAAQPARPRGPWSKPATASPHARRPQRRRHSAGLAGHSRGSPAGLCRGTQGHRACAASTRRGGWQARPAACGGDWAGTHGRAARGCCGTVIGLTRASRRG